MHDGLFDGRDAVKRSVRGIRSNRPLLFSLANVRAGMTVVLVLTLQFFDLSFPHRI